MLLSWQARTQAQHQVEIVSTSKALTGGDLLFLISCTEMIARSDRDRYRATLVIHASDLPKGRGWSPHIWQLLEGRSIIPVTLLEADDKVDSGAIWGQRYLHLDGHELFDEINSRLFDLESELMDLAVANADTMIPTPQRSDQPTYYRKRTPEDSRIDPHQSIAAQFDLLRVADPQRFPAFFDFRGCRYRIKLEKMPSE
jgi:methionyl-tRNA formyltransferase